MNEIVYILTNEGMPGYVKIGRTTNLEQRIRSLDTTSVPLPFECFYACIVVNAQKVESHLHDAFMNSRVRTSREFFEIAPERVVSALKLVEIENVTPTQDYVETQEDQQAIDKAKIRRGRFNFRMVDIPIGAELIFGGDENITAQVVHLVGTQTIEYDGKITSLSASAKEILEVNYPVSGTDHWTYDGEALHTRRLRMESQI